MFQEIKDILSLESQIITHPDDVNSEKCIEYLKSHIEDIEELGKFLFDFSYTDYKVSRTKNNLIKAIISSFPNLLDVFIGSLFRIPNESFKDKQYLNDRNINIIKESIIKDAKYTYEQFAEVIGKVIRPPYTIFTKHFLKNDIQLRKYLEKINPEIYKVLDEHFSRLQAIIDTFQKVLFYPKVIHCDSSNPRISKFGGSLPYLPSKGPKVCSCGGDKLQTVFSLYIPSLPQQIQDLFPSGHEYLVVGSTCNSCYEILKVDLYTDSEIDELVYDSIPSEDDIFNDARTIVSWHQSYMVPTGLTDSGFTLPNSEKYTDEDLYFIEDMLRATEDDRKETYLGGYPYFIQGDDTPPNHVLLLEMEEGEASTNLWGDCGTCQVWMTTGEDFGSFIMTYACS